MKKTQAKPVILRLVVSLVVLGGAYLGLATFLSQHVPANATVNGIAIGGMSHGEAAGFVQRKLATRTSQPIHLQTPSGTVDIDPRTAGLGVDVQATLSDLGAFTLNPVRLWVQLVGANDQPLKVRVDRAKLAAAVTEAARAVDTPVKEGSIAFTGGKVTVVVSAAGQAVKVPETTDAVASAWPGQQVVKAVMNRSLPKVSGLEINRAATEFAVPAMSGSVEVLAGPAIVTLRPGQYASALSFATDGDNRLQPVVDPLKLLAAIRAVDPHIERLPVDATVTLEAGAPHVVPDVIGTTFDKSTAPASFLAALTSPRRVAIITLNASPPKVTTAMARAWQIKEVISTFTTQFPFNPPRTNNIKIAVGTLNGTLIRPGAQFSLNRTLGERTPSKGYQQAPVIYAGRLVTDYGGGVSQVSTTTFNAAFFSGVRIDRYTPHSFYIARYPEGREATVSWPGVDQQWTNDTGFGILIKATVVGNDLTVTFLGTKTWDIQAVRGPRRNVVQPRTIVDDRTSCVPQSPTAGFDVTVARIFSKNGTQIKTSSFSTHYIPEDNVQCSHPAAS
ncbi:MAG: VanW family protein [Actinomycetota bacterium]